MPYVTDTTMYGAPHIGRALHDTMARFEERIAMLRREVEGRGMLWVEGREEGQRENGRCCRGMRVVLLLTCGHFEV